MTAVEDAKHDVRDAGRGSRRSRVRMPSAATRSSVIWAALGFCSGLDPLDDNSFLTHLRTGHWILGHGIPREDMYSYTAPGMPWIAQSWLAESLYAVLDEFTGPKGILVMNGIVGAAIAFLAFRLADRLRNGGRTVHIVLPALAVSLHFWVERPLLFGVLAFLVLLWIVEVPDSRAGRRPLATVPVLMCLWANVHGSFALGFLYIALHLAGRRLDGAALWQGRERRLVWAAALGFAACLINPYGYRLLLFPLTLLSKGEVLRHVQEWQSPDFRSTLGVTFAVWIAVFAAVLARAPRRASRRDLVVAVAFLLLGFWALRNLAIASLVGLPIAARLLATPEKGRERRSPADLGVIVVMTATVALVSGTILSRPVFAFDEYPVRAMRVIEQKGLLGQRLFTTHTWNAYVIHAYWPRQKVFMDDRYDMYPVAFTREYMKVRNGGPEWRGMLDRYRVQVVMWETGAPLTQLVATDRAWRQIYRDRQATVFVRR
ncbi:hypothetical protein [Actinomadura livida]|uniref:Glycosyltransferase RgtA/B/C/D-like domain-containing protein n=1 Tax=Actinomadura livida TaxID=79909 RepID=A0A7W7MWX2_9ACTN|nr:MULTISPECIES: hypothetical protein [Actinomadura]MBB4773299.1 hypothetical protein [Actinomadura catellatispora]GGU33246.1 hypothetical protein GCM10010208_67330 [Actinomadura livida]